MRRCAPSRFAAPATLPKRPRRLAATCRLLGHGAFVRVCLGAPVSVRGVAVFLCVVFKLVAAHDFFPIGIEDPEGCQSHPRGSSILIEKKSRAAMG